MTAVPPDHDELTLPTRGAAEAGNVAADPRLSPLLDARARGWLGPLDLALARFLLDLAPAAPASLVLGVAWLSRAVSLGHAALDLDHLGTAGPGLLGWPEAARETWVRGCAAMPTSADAARQAWRSAGVLLQIVGSMGPEAPMPVDAPWVLDGARLYLRRSWRAEVAVAADLTRRAATLSATPSAASPGVAAHAEGIDIPGLDTWLDRLFGAADGEAAVQTADQRAACRAAVRAQLAVVTGGPGTGKTFTAARLLVLLHGLAPQGRPLRVGLAAPTGKAAARLRQSLLAALDGLSAQPDIGAELRARAAAAPARTLHAWLGLRSDGGAPAHGPRRPLPLDLLLLDEASMVDLALMNTLLTALPSHARLVLLGDADQLASVEAGSVLGDLCRAPGGSAVATQTVRLQRSRRFEGPIATLAAAVRDGDAAAALRALPAAADASTGIVRTCPLPPERQDDPIGPAALAMALSADPTRAGHGLWLSRLGERPSEPVAFGDWVRDLLLQLDAFRVLCALREGPRGVAGWNTAIERAAVRRGWISRRGDWYDGRPVMVTRNDPTLELFNGDIGVVLKSPSRDGDLSGGLRAWFLQGTQLRSVAVGRLPPVETAFAMTVHKSQGSEFAHVMLVLPDEDQPVLTRELLYTAITRARQAVTVAARDPAVLAAAVNRVTVRMGGLAQRWAGS